MKIINTVHATKNNTAAVSGSTNTPTLNQVSPRGNQLMDDSKGCCPRCSTPSARAKTIMLPNHDSNAAPTAIVWLSALLRFVNSTIKKNANKGGSGISQINVSVVIVSLPLHHVNFIRHNCVATAIYRDDQRETYSYFCCGNREDDNCEYLPRHYGNITISPECSQVDVHRVEH